MYGKDSYFSGSMFVFSCFYGVFMPGLRSRGNGGEPPYLINQKVSWQLLFGVSVEGFKD